MSSGNVGVSLVITAAEKILIVIDDIDNEFDEVFFGEGDRKESMQKKKKLLRGDSSPNHKESARGEKKIKSREIEMNTLESEKSEKSGKSEKFEKFGSKYLGEQFFLFKILWFEVIRLQLSSAAKHIR